MGRCSKDLYTGHQVRTLSSSWYPLAACHFRVSLGSSMRRPRTPLDNDILSRTSLVSCDSKEGFKKLLWTSGGVLKTSCSLLSSLSLEGHHLVLVRVILESLLNDEHLRRTDRFLRFRVFKRLLQDFRCDLLDSAAVRSAACHSRAIT